MKNLLIAIVLLLPNLAFADLSKFYIGATMGSSWGSDDYVDDLEKEIEPYFGSYDFYRLEVNDNLSSTLKGIFVGYQVAEWLAVEIDYARVIESSISIHEFGGDEELVFRRIDGSADRISLSLLPSHALSNNFDLYGRLGYGFSDISYEYTEGGPVENYAIRKLSLASSETESETGLILGAGIKFSTYKYYIRVEAQRDFTGIEGLGSHMDSLVGSVGYKF